MLSSRENIRILKLTSLLSMLLFSFGLLILCDSLPTSSSQKEKSTTGVLLISKPDGAISSGVTVDICQRSWIPNEGNFRLISFARNQYFENRTVDHSIALLKHNFQKSIKFHFSFHLFQLYRPEKDEIPLLS